MPENIATQLVSLGAGTAINRRWQRPQQSRAVVTRYVIGVNNAVDLDNAAVPHSAVFAGLPALGTRVRWKGGGRAVATDIYGFENRGGRNTAGSQPIFHTQPITVSVPWINGSQPAGGTVTTALPKPSGTELPDSDGNRPTPHDRVAWRIRIPFELRTTPFTAGVRAMVNKQNSNPYVMLGTQFAADTLVFLGADTVGGEDDKGAVFTGAYEFLAREEKHVRQTYVGGYEYIRRYPTVNFVYPPYG